MRDPEVGDYVVTNARFENDQAGTVERVTPQFVWVEPIKNEWPGSRPRRRERTSIIFVTKIEARALELASSLQGEQKLYNRDHAALVAKYKSQREFIINTFQQLENGNVVVA